MASVLLNAYCDKLGWKISYDYHVEPYDGSPVVCDITINGKHYKGRRFALYQQEAADLTAVEVMGVLLNLQADRIASLESDNRYLTEVMAEKNMLLGLATCTN
jgi:hypothetical protein